MKNLLLLVTLIFVMSFTGCSSSSSDKKGDNNIENACCSKAENRDNCCVNNVLTEKEIAEGWKLLFDGKTINGWHGFQGEDISAIWVAENGCLVALGKGDDIGGDLLTEKMFENFELKLEWKTAHGGNSGILYGVIDDPKYKAVYYTGPEYQLLDDVGFPMEVEEWQLTGANYGMYNADKAKKKLQIVGGCHFNTSRLIVNKNHVEHWLNGEKIVEFERWNDEWFELKKNGKWKDFPDYGMAKKGHIALQDHGSKIWFKNIKIKEL